jgi:hypothetical protein
MRRLWIIIPGLMALAWGCSSDPVCYTPEFGCIDDESQAPQGVTPITTPGLDQFATDVFPILGPPCGGGFCHSVSQPAAGQDYTIDKDATIGSTEMETNWTTFVDQFTCFGSRNAADIDGPFWVRLGDGLTHSGVSLQASQLTTIQTWAQTGEYPPSDQCP